MSEDAVHIALNALAVLEETSPTDALRYRRLLPAIALDFAKARKPFSETDLLELVANAHIFGSSLHTQFTQKPFPQKEPTYEEIARKLDPDYGKPHDLSGAIRYGNTSRYHDLTFLSEMPDERYLAHLRHAARLGHLVLCNYLLKRMDFSSVSQATLINTALEHEQYHVVFDLKQTYEPYIGELYSCINSKLNEDKKSLLAGFERMVHAYRNVRNVEPEYFIGLENWQNVRLHVGNYLKIRGHLKREVMNVRTLNQLAFKAHMVFGTSAHLMRFLDKWGAFGSCPLERLLSKLNPPVTNHANWPMWASGLIKFGPRMFFPLTFALAMGSPETNRDGHISLIKTKFKIWRKYFPHDNAHAKIAKLCFELQTTSATLSKAIKLWEEKDTRPVSPPNTIPDISLPCNDIGLKNYRLEKLSNDDERIMFLGYYNDCCEKVGDHFESTIHHALTTNESGFYVLTSDGEIRAHSWVWRGEGGQIIIDGWESNDDIITVTALKDITTKIKNHLTGDDINSYGITDILIGMSNANLPLHDCYPIAHEMATRFACSWYFDEEPSMRLVHRIKAPDNFIVFGPSIFSTETTAPLLTTPAPSP